MGDRGIGHEFLQIGLHHGDERAVDNPDDGQDANERGKLARRSGKQRQAEAQHAVGPHFQQNACQDDGARRGRLNVRIGQPGVEREKGNLDGKGDEEGQEEPAFRCGRKHGTVREVSQHSRQIKSARDVVKVDDSREHQGRAGHGEKDKLDAAYTRRSWPQMPIRKYMGISITSQKRRRGPDRARQTLPSFLFPAPAGR